MAVHKLWQDLKYAGRTLRNNPGFTVVAVLTLALGIGANAAIFTVVNSVLLLPLPFPNANQLVRMWATLPPGYGTVKGAVSVLDLKDWQTQNQVFQGIAAYELSSFNLRNVDNPERIASAYVTSNFFDVMGLRPTLGRGFVPGEDIKGREHVAVLSNALWKAMFGQDPKVVGQNIRLNSETYSIVGVMPSEFRFPSANIQLWTPLVPTPEQQANRGTHFLQVVGRMKPGTAQAAVQTQMSAIMRRMAQQNEEDAFYRGVYIEGLQQAAVENIRESLLILLAAVVLVFLVACANVVNLLLARTIERQREVYIRTAMGATRGRLARQFFTEALLLALFGASIAWIFALWGSELVGTIRLQNLPTLKEIRPDLQVLGYTFILSVVAALSMSLGVALQSSKIGLADNLKEGSATMTSSRRQGRARRSLVIGQIAGALVLMIGALLLIKSLDRLLQVNPGFEPEHVLTMQIALPPVKYSPSHPEFEFYQPVLENIDTLPGVRTAGLVSLLPIQSYGSETSFQIAGRPKAPPSAQPFAEARAASPNYFPAFGIPLLRGRYFAEQDDATAPVVVLINKALADEYFANEDPVGKQLVVDIGKTAGKDVNMSLTIVGVVGNTRQFGLAEAPHPEFDICFLQAHLLGPLATKYFIQTMSLVVRTTGDPTAVANAVREAILRVDPDQPVFNVQTMKEVISTSINNRRFEMLLLGAFAGLGLTLAILGIYGVISYGVRQRTHEIGIRMALGAQRLNVLNMVIGDGIKLALIGICIGIVGALTLMRFLSNLLYGIAPTDPVTFVSVIILLFGVAVLACYIPARTATRVDPMRALRHE